MGFVGAEPSEYLVTTRRGVVDMNRSGQGMRIYKWPWHSIAIVPTTLQRVEFAADQITRERVGVGVTGIAVFRIAEPLLAFRVLDFSAARAPREQAAAKLAATMREMFVGAARRLIANLTLDDCLTRRKEAIAGFLMDEIAPVVGGTGAPGDTTSKGWGVVIDTIEIQQVHITSEKVFAHLQAPYRAEIAARAELADLERARQVNETTATAARRAAELARERALHDIEIAEEHRRMTAAAEIAALEVERGRLEASHRQALLELEHQRACELDKQAAELEHARRQADAAIELRRRDAEAREHELQLDAVHQRRLAELEQLVAKDRALAQFVAALPQIAAAFKQTYGTLNFTQLAPGTGPLDAVPAAFTQLLALARSFGLELGE
jgi:hypothetical protein